MKTFGIFFILAAVVLRKSVVSQNVGDMEIIAEWTLVEFDWDSEDQKNASLADGTYIPTNNIITGIKVHTDSHTVFVSVSRWLPGVPSTMNTLVFEDGTPLLKPYPSWEMQEIDNCDAFQHTQSMEIVPQTNEMWVIDVGRRHIWTDDPIDRCPPKIRIFDLTTNELVFTHTFPNAVFSYTGNFLNDIVVDPEGGYAYLSDVGESSTNYPGGIVFFDRNQNVSRRLQHPSMLIEPNRPDGGYDLVVNGTVYDFEVPSDGIALSTDREKVFYCPLSGLRLFQVEAATLRSCDQDVCTLADDEVRDMGPKVSESGGIAWGHRSLYIPALGENAIYRWDHQADMEEQGVTDLWNVNMTKQELTIRDDEIMIWSDTLAMDGEGWLWTTANHLPMFFNRELDFSEGMGPYFRIVKVFVDDESYLVPEANASVAVHSQFLVMILSIAFSVSSLF